MTPFGLRKRVKELLATKPGEDPRVELRVTLPDGRVETLRAAPGERAWALLCAREPALPPACADGRCGACVLRGGAGLSPPDAAEEAARAQNALARPLRGDERLGCHARIQGPAQLWLDVGWTLEDLPEFPG